MGMFEMFKPKKKKKNIFEERQEMLNEINDWQQNKAPEESFPNMRKKRKR